MGKLPTVFLVFCSKNWTKHQGALSRPVLSILTQETCPLEPTFCYGFLCLLQKDKFIHLLDTLHHSLRLDSSICRNNFPGSSNFCYLFSNICCLFIFAERQIHPFVGYVAQFFETGFVHVQK